jgi:type II secretory ATPase GspE/PulE/Tfp pilus assembly ATPase PilB-like protein
MLADAQFDSLQTLYNLYRDRFDTDKILKPLDADTNVVQLWNKIENETDIDSVVLCEQIAEITGVPFHHGDIQTPAQLAKKVPRKTLSRFHIAIVGMEEGEPVIATGNPLDAELIEALAFMFGSHYRLVVASPEIIARGIESVQQVSSGDKATTKGLSLTDAGDSAAENRATPVLARQLMLQAVNQNASDMHIQPFLNGSVVRIRVDGRLKRLTLLPDKVADAMIRHFKAKSGMDPTGNMVPQDGRMLVEVDGREYDLRISTLPVAGHKEKLVVRFLSRQSVYKLTDIGFSLDEIHTVQRLSARPSGVILVCGPTGSGKTTTLYSILSTLNDEATSIMTVENPVEYQMQGLSQTEVNEKAGMTFAGALRAILRQDPDVLLIGEIRDQETAQIAMQSALTGHLVFSTLHTNDSLSAIPRLLDLGINPVILAESLSGIMSQRLLRKLCSHCKREVEATDPAAKAFKTVTHVEQACAPVGCQECEFSGYHGRTVIAELVEINQEQRELLLGGVNDIAKFKAAMRGTFNSMSLSASRLIISGITTATEASRVIGHQFWLALADEYGSELPDLSALSGTGKQSKKERKAIVLAGDLDQSSQRLQNALENSWLEVLTADGPDDCEKILREHENAELVVLELNESLTDDEIVASVADYRRHLAWARLPALIRLPASKQHWEALLTEHGATSRFVSRDTEADDIIEIIQQAISEKLDFRWGIQARAD